MLQDLREKATSKTTVVILIILALSIGLWGIQNYFHGSGQQAKVLATVNDTELTEKELTPLLNQRTYEYRAQGPITPQLKAKLQQETLRELIHQTLLLQHAEANHLSLPHDYVQAALMHLPVFLDKKQQFSSLRYQQLLRGLNYAPQDFFDYLKKILLIGQLKKTIVDTSFQPPYEKKLHQSVLNQERSVRVLTAKTSQETLPKGSVTKTMIQHMYKANTADYQSPQSLQIAYLDLKASQFVKQQTLKESDVQHYFNEHRANYQGKKLSDVKANIRSQLLNAKAEKAYLDAVDVLADATYTHPEDLDFAAKTLGLKVHTTDALVQGEKYKQALWNNPLFVEAAFNPELAESGFNSPVIALSPERSIVMRVAKFHAARVLTLKEARPTILAKLKQQQQQEQLKERLEQLKKQLIAEQPLAGKPLFKVHKHLTLTSTEPGVPVVLLKAIFLMPAHGQKPAVSIVPMPEGQGYWLVELLSHQATVPQGGKQQKATEKLLDSQLAFAEFQSYLSALKAKSTIK